MLLLQYWIWWQADKISWMYRQERLNASVVHSFSTSQSSAGGVFFRSSLLSPILRLTEDVHPKLAGTLTPLIESTAEDGSRHFNAAELNSLATVPNVSCISVLRFLEGNEDFIISNCLQFTEDEYGDFSVESATYLTAELKQLLRWFIILLPLSESIGSEDGSEFLDQTSLVTACRSLKVKKFDRSLFLSAITSLGRSINTCAQRTGDHYKCAYVVWTFLPSRLFICTMLMYLLNYDDNILLSCCGYIEGGVGGAWNEANGAKIFSRLSLAIKKAAYAVWVFAVHADWHIFPSCKLLHEFPRTMAISISHLVLICGSCFKK